jgi:tetratricopeptide (TPR) repeat protein
MKFSTWMGVIWLLCLASVGAVQAQNAANYFATGEHYAQQGKWGRAILEYDEAIRHNPQYAQAYIGLARAYNNQADYKNAIEAAQKATRLDPNNMLAFYNLGAAYYQKKLWSKAQAAFDTAYKLDSNTAEANIGEGLMHLHFNRPADAIASFKKALEISPDSPVGCLGLGMAYVVNHDRKDAQSQCDILVVLSPPLAKQLQNAIAKMRDGDSAQVASNGAESGKADSQPKTASRWPVGLLYAFGVVPIALVAGWFLYMRNRPAPEPPMNERIEIRDPNSLIDSPMVPIVATPFPRTIRQSQEILPASPSLGGDLSAPTPRPRADTPPLLDTPSHLATSNSQFRAGNHHYKAGKYEEALEAYKDSIRLNPNNMEAHNGLGQCYARMEDWEAAADAYKQALRINPDNANVHCNLGEAYQAREQFQDALEAYKQAIRLTPNDPKAHFQYGMISVALNDKSSALDEFKILKKMSSDMANKLFNAIYPS